MVAFREGTKIGPKGMDELGIERVDLGRVGHQGGRFPERTGEMPPQQTGGFDPDANLINLMMCA